MFRELKGGETPSAKSLKRQLQEYYSNASTTTKQPLERLLDIKFSYRYRDICTPSHWGQFDDALCLANIYGVKFNIVTVESSEVFRVLHMETVHGVRHDGHRVSKPHKLLRCLVYFTKTRIGVPHHGVGVPVFVSWWYHR